MKFKKLLSVILSVIIVFGMLFVVNAETEIPDGYTPIYTAEDLNDIRNNLDGKYILMNDIDLSVYENWEPIGTAEEPFTGEFDGNGKSVLNLTIKDYQVIENKIYIGMFSSMNSCSVMNLNLVNVDIDIRNTNADSLSVRVGALAGYASKCFIENCAVTGNITVNNFSTGYIGGLLGSELSSMPSECANYADISVSSDYFNNIGVGGIAGCALMITECCNYGDITVSSKDTDDADSDVYIGGICGKPHQFGNAIRDCYNRGPIFLDFTTPSTYAGGIIGQCVNLEKCYNSGKISHPHIIEIFSGAISGEILTMLSTGGRVSYIDTAYYTNSNVSCVFRPDEYDDIKNVKQLEIQEFRKQESFVGFDFENIWEMEENGYPVLKNQPKVVVKKSVELEVGETYQIKEGKDYKVHSDSPLCVDYITYPENGEIQAIHPGRLTFTVIYDYGYTAEYDITITEAAPSYPVIPNPKPLPENNVESAEIVYVPLKNRIVFSAGSPNLPDGIVLKLTYKDGTEKTETVIYNAAEGCYRAGEERVIGSVRTEVEEYGLLTDTLYINDNTVSAEYDYFVPPTLSYVFMEIVNFVLRIVL